MTTLSQSDFLTEVNEKMSFNLTRKGASLKYRWGWGVFLWYEEEA
jgi:hypothetical protein